MFFSNTQVAFALPQTSLNKTDKTVIEYLRLSVPKNHRKAWLLSEKDTWEPWLNEQKGFLGRQLLWDPEKEEAILLISWASKSDWKDIPQADIESVQEDFEQLAMKAPGKRLANPFPINDQGELIPQ